VTSAHGPPAPLSALGCVLNPGSDAIMHSRLLLCEATGVLMRKCFQLLGIEWLEQI
jgi:arginyl-tRNA synthetase